MATGAAPGPGPFWGLLVTCVVVAAVFMRMMYNARRMAEIKGKPAGRLVPMAAIIRLILLAIAVCLAAFFSFRLQSPH